jgi:Arc/MetJ-type ribon-helix-helix transcriptional regulator
MPTSARDAAPQEGGATVTIRLSSSDLAALDAWIAAQSGPRPDRSEAVRRILNRELGAFDEHARDAIRVGDLNSGNDV